MINLVRCGKSMEIRLPESVSCKEGDNIPCPQGCKYKSSYCNKVKSFSVIYAWQSDKEKANAVKYSDEEIKSYWRKENEAISLPDDGGSSAEQDNSVSAVPERSYSVCEVKHPNTFGKPRRASSENSSETDDVLKPQKRYESFTISGKVFTDDERVRASKRSRPLKNALWEIFSYWETRSVFTAEGELRDDFVWLINSVCKQNFKKSKVDSILSNTNYSLSQKFFYLFYDVVFNYEPPKGFYWCDNVLSPEALSAYFKDRKDFVVKYCASGSKGEQFRAFYSARKNEVLHFLGDYEESKLFEDMTLSLAKDVGEVILIDKYNDYMPINMGKLDAFIANMRQPSKLADMRNMVRFLEKYRITCFGVVMRTDDYPFEKSERGDLQEDGSMYAALKLSSSSCASEYDCFTAILREYVKTFNPDEVSIGTLTFTKSNYSCELEEIVKNFCKTHFGQVYDEEYARCKSCAWLAKSIYERRILSSYTLENGAYVDKLMKLIANPTLKQYFSTFADCVFSINNRELSVRDYIAESLREDVFTVCGRFREDEIIREFFDFKIKDWTKTDLNELFDKYSRQYDSFVNS